MPFQTKHVRAFLCDEAGASSSEYALILGVIGVGVGAATLVLGANVGASVNGKAASFDAEFTESSEAGPPGGGPGNGSGGTGEPGGGNNGNGNNGGGNGPPKGGNGKNK